VVLIRVHSLNSRFGIHSFPVVLLFTNGTSSHRAPPRMTVEELVAWLETNTGACMCVPNASHLAHLICPGKSQEATITLAAPLLQADDSGRRQLVAAAAVIAALFGLHCLYLVIRVLRDSASELIA
jgi:hypothetical protein